MGYYYDDPKKERRKAAGEVLWFIAGITTAAGISVGAYVLDLWIKKKVWFDPLQP
jgi:hypothetical protein